MPVRTAFRSITTDVNGLHPGHATKVDAANRKAVRRMEKNMKKVTDKFTHDNSPVYHISRGIGEPPDAPGGPIGRSMAPTRLRARWAMSSTSNDPILFYLNSGARRFRSMSLDWQSMTRGGMGLRTFPRAGSATTLYGHPVGYIEPRNFAADAVARERLQFERAIKELFGRNAIYRFFGRTVHRS